MEMSRREYESCSVDNPFKVFWDGLASVALMEEGFALEIPEDLYHLIKKAIAIRKHLERNRKDKDSKFRLILVERRIHRLTRYYKKTKKLPPNWK
nr:40S ribosomal protein S13-2-like [Coffea arabica]